MFANLNGWHAVIILIVILLLFGAPKIPALAKSVGQSLKIFRNEIKPEFGAATEDGLERTESSGSEVSANAEAMTGKVASPADRR